MATIGAGTVLNQSIRALEFWKSNPALQLYGVTVEDFEKSQGALRESIAKAAILKSELRDEIRRRNRLQSHLNTLNSRLRSGARGHFGPDSVEYQIMGGKRRKDRKRRARKAQASSPAGSGTVSA